MIEILKQMAAAIVALTTIGGAAWAIGQTTGYRPWLLIEQNDFTKSQFQLVMDQTQQNTRILAQFKFDELWAKRKYSELTWEEKMSLCSIALSLSYTVVDEQNRLICSNDGTPVLVFPAK